VFAQYVALPARRVVMEEVAPVRDQVVERARLDEGVIGDAEMRAGAGSGPVLGPDDQPQICINTLKTAELHSISGPQWGDRS
jgi:hypothetical protein